MVKQGKSQENILTWNEVRPLRWIDFCGPEKDTSQYDAESFAEVRYQYTFKSQKDFSFKVMAGFNKNISWFRKRFGNRHLLRHEQIHFDIAELFARKIRKLFENYNYSENYAAEIVSIFNEKKAAYHAMQFRYDKETGHSLNKKKQKQWENYIANELSGTSPRLLNTYDFAKASSGTHTSSFP